jgi:hypothetical protein
MNKRDRYFLQKIKENKKIALFLVFGLVALGVFIGSFFLSVELIVPVRIVSIIILLIPPFFILVVFPLFSLLFEGICGDRIPLGRKISEDKLHTSLSADDPKEVDWLFSDERLYGKVFTEQYEDLTRGVTHSDPSPDDDLTSAYDIERDTLSRRTRYLDRKGSPFGDAGFDLHTDLLKEYMSGGKIEEIETEEEYIERLKKIPRISNEISILEKIIDGLKGINKKIHHSQRGITYSFSFEHSHNLSFLIVVTVRIDTDNRIILEAILRKYQPFSISFLNLKEKKERDTIDTSEAFRKYSIDATYLLDYEAILSKNIIGKYLIELYPLMERLTISKKFVTITLLDSEGIATSLKLVKEIYKELKLRDLGIVEVSEVRCYNCNSVLKSDIEKCQKCGILRPRCIVCCLDLYPSEKSKIITTPCCGVLAHKEHIIMWLKRNKTCPYCKEVLSRWLDKLEMSLE